MTIVISLLLVLICLLLFLLFKRQQPDAVPSLTLMQQHIETLRSDVSAGLQNITENVNHQLSSVTRQLQSQTGSIGDRLDTASRIVSDVHRHLGELNSATEEIKQLGMSVSKLDELLRAPKLRGGLGEFLLEDLLKQVLPADHFVMQYRFRNGSIVDAVVRTSDHMVPVDSKFPLENFRKMLGTELESEKKNMRRAFINDVQKHIDAIAEKYIRPDEGTFPFALMYIPAENIYYEVIIKDDATTASQLYDYAIARKVVPVSPNSFYAYLQVIALGLRGLSIETDARQILNTLSRLQGDIAKIRESFETLGTHLENARKKFDETDKRLSNFSLKVDQAAEYSLQPPQHTPAGEQALIAP